MRVAWVHPSWRDLVIDRLAYDVAARRRFLSRCGPAGVGLALSSGGGASGERAFPLLRVDADWDALGDRLHELLGEADMPELIGILAALEAAVDEAPDGSAARREAVGLAEAALARVAHRWDGSRAPIPLGGLEAWLRLGGRLPSRPELPALGLTWAELLPVRVPDPDDRAEVQRFSDWLVLCRLLWDWEAAWRSLEFGRDQVLLTLDFVDRVEAGRVAGEHVLGALEAIAALLPQLRSRAQHAAALVRRPESVVELVTPPEPDPRLELGSVDVARILADL